MNKISSIYQKLGRALLLAWLISLGAVRWDPAAHLTLAHSAYQEAEQAPEDTPGADPLETPTPTPPEAAPVEATETPVPEPPPTETPTPEPPVPAAQPVIRVAPADLPLAVGGTGRSEIQIEAATGLYGVDLRLTFDPETVTVVDVDPDRAGVQIGLGTLFQGQDVFLIRNRVNNSTGVIEFAVTLRQPAPPIDGSGSLANISWQGLGSGVTVLAVETSLSDPAGGVIEHQSTGGQVTVSGETGEPITGRILLQGRTDHRGTQLFLSPESCSAAFQDPGPGILITETAGDGSFEFLPPAGVTYQCLRAVKPGYLAGQKNAPQGNISPATLLGGDVTGDQIIDVFDLAFLGSHYGDANTTADINGDGTVSIFDLTITAANYLSEGPTTLE